MEENIFQQFKDTSKAIKEFLLLDEHDHEYIRKGYNEMENHLNAYDVLEWLRLYDKELRKAQRLIEVLSV